MKKIKCSLCGGEIDKTSCKFCDRQLSEEEVKEIEITIDKFNHYNSFIRKKILKKEVLSNEEDELFKKLLEKDVIKEDELDDAIILYYILSGKKIISYDTFENVIKRSAEKYMKQLNNNMIKNYNPKVNIIPLNNLEGCAIKHYIVDIDKSSIEKLYDGDIIALVTYFHEVQHVFQSILFESGYVSLELMIMLKDRIIKQNEFEISHTNNYYNDNYKNISYEIDAEEKGINYTINLLKQFGFEPNENYFNKLRENYSNDVNNKDRIIIVDGKKETVSLDVIFDELIKKYPKYLQKYPQLNIEYCTYNNEVRKRSKEELKKLLDNTNNENITNYINEIIKSYNDKGIK